MLKLKGTWTIKQVRNGKVIHKEVSYNIIPYEGINHILSLTVASGAGGDTWYAGLFKNNVTPVLSDTVALALGSAGTYGEITDTDFSPLTNRPTVTWGTIANGSVDNSAATIAFTAIATSTVVYGGFICSSQAKLATTGILLSAKLFSAPRTLLANDILYLTVQINATSA